MRILVVEDDKSIQMLLELIFTQMTRHQVVFADEGKKGLGLIKGFKPDVVILDLMLPGMDGFEICEKAKQDPETKDVPIIFLTAQAQPFAPQKAVELGALGYITKPFEPAQFLQQVDTLLKKAGGPSLLNASSVKK